MKNNSNDPEVLDLPEGIEAFQLPNLMYWWLIKRFHYNKIIGGIGLGLSILVLLIGFIILKSEMEWKGIARVFGMYLLYTNIAFSFGFWIDLIHASWTKERLADRRFGQKLYRRAYLISILLILLFLLIISMLFSGF